VTLRRTIALLFVATLILIMAGCKPKEEASTGAGTTPTAPTKAAKPAKSYVIGMSQCNLNEPWRKRMNDDIKKAAEAHPEVKVEFKDAQNSTESQQAQVREFITSGINLLIISPKEAMPLVQPVQEAMDAKIPVIVLDRDLSEPVYTCFIGGDNVMIGREAGKYMVKLLGSKGKIVELKGLETSVPSHDRHNGFMEGIKGSDIEIIYDQDCEWLEEKAQAAMSTALARSDEIDAVYGHNDPSAHGAWVAAQQEGKGREKTIKFIGIDGNPDEGQRYVKEGILSATFDYQTGGKEAIETALKILNGEEVPKRIALGTVLFTPDNVDQGGEPIAVEAADATAEPAAVEEKAGPQ